MIIEIIMLDLESDYPEVINNFTSAIDTEKFIQSHQEAIQKRKDRLENEYQEKLERYKEKLKLYEEKVQEQRSKSFFKRILSEDIEKPRKPIRRE
jgi:FtsZ-binding cell division protein ZapB